MTERMNPNMSYKLQAYLMLTDKEKNNLLGLCHRLLSGLLKFACLCVTNNGNAFTPNTTFLFSIFM